MGACQNTSKCYWVIKRLFFIFFHRFLFQSALDNLVGNQTRSGLVFRKISRMARPWPMIWWTATSVEFVSSVNTQARDLSVERRENLPTNAMCVTFLYVKRNVSWSTMKCCLAQKTSDMCITLNEWNKLERNLVFFWSFWQSYNRKGSYWNIEG